MQYIYLHGFASSPDSTKARFFRKEFADRGLTLICPDLNGGDFSHLTLTRQIEQLQEITGSFASEEPITLIGSSMGGLVSLLYAGLDDRVSRLVLLAPAAGFHRILSQKAGPMLKQWRQDRYMPVEHHAFGRSLPLHFDIYRDALRYRRIPHRPLPALIFHGLNDDTVPYQNSIQLVEQNPLARLMLLPSDHSLTDSLDTIAAHTWLFLGEQ